MEHEIHDVIIIGAGPAGTSAAMVLARCHRKVLVMDDGRQRNLKSHGLHNYLTRDGILPPEYLAMAHDELNKYPVTILPRRAVQAHKLETMGFEITDAEGEKHLCKKLLLATGVMDIIPDIPGMHELWGCSVFHCPYCDGWECSGKTIGLYAHNVNGYGMALALREFTDDITLYTDGARYLRTKQRNHLLARGIKIIAEKINRLQYTNKKLEAIELVNGNVIKCDAIFTDNGHKVNRELLDQLGCTSTKIGAAITNKQQQTSIEGVYAAGDASFDMHFVVVAAAEGVKAAVSIHSDLLQKDNLYRE